MVPVLGSTARSTKTSRPFCGKRLSSARNSWSWRFGIARPALGVEADPAGEPQVVGLGDGEVGVDGVHGGDVARSVGSLLPTRLPRSTWILPMIPLMGRLNRRVAEIQLRLDHRRPSRTAPRPRRAGSGSAERARLSLRAASAASTSAMATFSWDSEVSRSCWGMALASASGRYRSTSCCALPSSALRDVELRTSAIHDGGVPGPREIGLRLGELGARRLERRRVLVALDHEQRLALLDLGALLEQHLLEHAGDPRPHLDGGDRLGARREVADDRDRCAAPPRPRRPGAAAAVVRPSWRPSPGRSRASGRAHPGRPGTAAALHASAVSIEDPSRSRTSVRELSRQTIRGTHPVLPRHALSHVRSALAPRPHVARTACLPKRNAMRWSPRVGIACCRRAIRTVSANLG